MSCGAHSRIANDAGNASPVSWASSWPLWGSAPRSHWSCLRTSKCLDPPRSAPPCRPSLPRCLPSRRCGRRARPRPPRAVTKQPPSGRARSQSKCLLLLCSLTFAIRAGADEKAAPSDASPRASLQEASTLDGGTGLLRVKSAGSGAVGTFRLSLTSSLYSGHRFLCGACEKPLVPNVNPRNRAKNRRVQLMLQKSLG